MRQLPGQPTVTQKYDEQKLVRFLNEIQRGYKQNIQYHNDLHGADVMQMMYIMLSKGGLIEIAELDHLDQVASLVAAACHDYDHDGFNNSYHVNAMTTRSVRYNDVSVQEAYHAAESFQVLLKPKNNFLSGMTSEDLKTFKRRMMGCILATDMAKHTEDIEAFKRTLQTRGISND